jgi:hypothetical protein
LTKNRVVKPAFTGYPLSGLWISQISGKNSIQCIPSHDNTIKQDILFNTKITVRPEAFNFWFYAFYRRKCKDLKSVADHLCSVPDPDPKICPPGIPDLNPNIFSFQTLDPK